MSAGVRYSFTKQNVDNSPASRGVYALFDGDELIYVGRANGETVTIRSRLQRHFSGEEGQCTQMATHYMVEVCANPVEREAELLKDYQWEHNGWRPRCNEVMP